MAPTTQVDDTQSRLTAHRSEPSSVTLKKMKSHPLVRRLREEYETRLRERRGRRGREDRSESDEKNDKRAFLNRLRSIYSSRIAAFEQRLIVEVARVVASGKTEMTPAGERSSEGSRVDISPENEYVRLSDEERRTYEPSDEEQLWFGEHVLGVSREHARWEDVIPRLTTEAYRSMPPEPWILCRHTTTGYLFYYNEQSGESSWEHPSANALRERLSAALSKFKY